LSSACCRKGSDLASMAFPPFFSPYSSISMSTFYFLNQPFNLFFIHIWFMLVWLLFVLFWIIYEINNFFQFHSPLFFSMVKFSPYYFDCYFLFRMIFKTGFFCDFILFHFSSILNLIFILLIVLFLLEKIF
jgi:hypothetical protein